MKKLDLCGEPDLLMAIRAGEAWAFSRIRGEYCRLLIGYAYNRVASQENAEDIVAEAFYRLFLAREGMQSLGHVRRFLYMVARNRAVDCVRAGRVCEKLTGDDLVYLSGEAVERTDEYAVLESDLIHRIYHEVENLPRKSRQVFKLYFYEEMSTAEISEFLKIHPQTVLNHKSSAVKSLRSRILLYRQSSS